MQSLRVVPANPSGGLTLHFPHTGPVTTRPTLIDQLGLIESDRRFHQGVVERVTDGADRPQHLLSDEFFGQRDSRILRTRIGMMDDALGCELAAGSPAGRQSHPQRVQDEMFLLVGRRLPPENPAREHISDERYVHETPGSPYI